MCLEAEELILPEEPILPDNPTPHQCKLWDLRATAMIKNEDTLKQNMRSLYVVVMSLCDANMKDKVKAHNNYAEIKRTRDTPKLLQVKREGVTDPTTEQLKQAKERVVEEFFSILFMYMVDRQRYGRAVEDVSESVTVQILKA